MLRSFASRSTAIKEEGVEVGACSLGGCLACLDQLPCQAKQTREQPLHCTLHLTALSPNSLDATG